MLVIFDWDGTLLDSTGKIVACMQAAIADVGIQRRSASEVKQVIGLGLPEAIRQLFPTIDTPKLAQLSQSYSAHFIEADQVPCAFYDGVLETIEALKATEHQLAIATGKSRKGLNRVLARLNMQNFFDATRCADETLSKPAPLMLAELLAELGQDAGNAVMVGDTEFDLEMANNAGIASIAVSYGAHSRERLLKHRPLHCIDHFPELLSCIQGR